MRIERCCTSYHFRWNLIMSKVEQIENDLKTLSPIELRKIRDWLDNLLEDELEFALEFESDIRESEREMREGIHPRTRKP